MKKCIKIWLKMLLVALPLLLPMASHAAGAGPDNEGFVPLAPGEQLQPGESIPASRLVASAYGFIFGVTLLYVVLLARRAQKNDEELLALTERLKAK